MVFEREVGRERDASTAVSGVKILWGNSLCRQHLSHHWACPRSPMPLCGGGGCRLSVRVSSHGMCSIDSLALSSSHINPSVFFPCSTDLASLEGPHKWRNPCR